MQNPEKTDYFSKQEWKSDGESQMDFMLEDLCILVDFDDKVIGHDNKYESHIFCPERPRGKLHRAFSVFLFDENGRLLLQQRAKDKITFPGVWTNTCCSHPLTGCTPTEIDGPEDLVGGAVPGVRRAAIRKLKHELGIPEEQLAEDGFRFLTRLHYWAADTQTHGEDSPWGEHEIDYVLFYQGKVEVAANREEVEAVEYVTLEDLLLMMMPGSGRTWSPWFQLLVRRFLVPWWRRLPALIAGTEAGDWASIHRFDCPEEFMGGAGGAGRWLDETGSTLFGDLWLGQVAVNGGAAPVTPAMKGLLAAGPDGRWRLEAQE